MLEERGLTASAGKQSAGETGAQLNFLNVQGILFALAGAIAFVIMWSLYTRLAWTVPMNSDHAAALLQANDFIHGNYLLRGWTAGNISIYTTELPFYVAGMIAAGFTPSLLRVIPALQFTIVVTLSLWLTYDRTRARDWRYGSILTFILLALPWGFATWMLIVSFKHIGTIMVMLAAFLTLRRIDERPSGVWHFAIFLALMTFAIMDDELAFFIGALPIVLVLGIRAALEWPKVDRKRLVLAAMAIASAPLGLILAHLIIRLGGFVAFAPEPTTAPSAVFVRNASLAFRGVLLLFGADPFDRFGVLRPLPFAMGALVHIFGIFVAILGAWRVLAQMTKGQRGDSLVSPILILAIVINVASFIVSDRAIDLGTTRYLTPVIVFGAVLAGIEVPPLIATRRFRWLSLGIAGVYLATFAPQLFSHRANEKQRTMVRWLEEHRLTQGYGNFWAAGILTAESGGSVKIRQVMATGAGYRPRLWMANRNWYATPPSDGTFNFLIFDNSNVDGVNDESARKNFGPPKQEYRVAGYKILVWDKRLPVRE